MWARNLLFLTLCGVGLLALGASLTPERKVRPQSDLHLFHEPAERTPIVRHVNDQFKQDWAAAGLTIAPQADDLTIARRLSLALTGSIPSLEEIRSFEAQPSEKRIEWWLTGLFADQRYHEYVAERLARAFVGIKFGQFIVYRRDRFRSWLADELRDNRPYDDIVRQLITTNGLGTDHPATNFIIGTIEPGQENGQPNKDALAARVSRAFLGVRIDCAECHDHPFEPWKQDDFRGLAAFFGETSMRFGGLRDKAPEPKRQDKMKMDEDEKDSKPEVAVKPHVPFLKELLPANESLRGQLAHWVTDPKNEAFARAGVNRTWALLFGRGLVEPIDDIRPSEQVPPVLELLAKGFVEHRYDLRWLIATIASTEAFQRDSRMVDSQEITADHENTWAVFPITRLRPEQVVGAITQAAALETLDYETHILLRLARLNETNDFVRRYGDAGEDEFAPQGATIPQRLLMMNGNLVREKTNQNPLLNAATHIAMLAPTDEVAIETAYLAILSRRPTPGESAYFAERFADTTTTGGRNQRLQDLYWTLLNSTEFSWNH